MSPLHEAGRKVARRSLAVAFGLALTLLAASCQSPGNVLQSPAASGPGWSEIAIPVPGERRAMPARLHLPQAGEGPFALAVVLHGSDQRPEGRVRMPMPEYRSLTGWLLDRGFAVLVPLRPGHGKAGGRYIEDQRGCAHADYHGSGLATARLIEAAIAAARARPDIRRDGVLVIGTSAGGWGAIAHASLNPAGVRGYVSFSGGRGGRNRGRAHDNCAPDRLVAAAAQFGASARIPALWLYAANDSYFAPELSTRLAEAYRAAGAPLDFELVEPIPGEGHGLIHHPAMRWSAALERFLSLH